MLLSTFVRSIYFKYFHSTINVPYYLHNQFWNQKHLWYDLIVHSAFLNPSNNRIRVPIRLSKIQLRSIVDEQLFIQAWFLCFLNLQVVVCLVIHNKSTLSKEPSKNCFCKILNVGIQSSYSHICNLDAPLFFCDVSIAILHFFVKSIVQQQCVNTFTWKHFILPMNWIWCSTINGCTMPMSCII